MQVINRNKPVKSLLASFYASLVFRSSTTDPVLTLETEQASALIIYTSVFFTHLMI